MEPTIPRLRPPLSCSSGFRLLFLFLGARGAWARSRASDNAPKISCYSYKHVEDPALVGQNKEFVRTVNCEWGVMSCVVLKGRYPLRNHFLGMEKDYFDGGCGPPGLPENWPNGTPGRPRNPTRFKCGGPLWGGGELNANASFRPELVDENETFPTGSFCADSSMDSPAMPFAFCRGFLLEATVWDSRHDLHWTVNFTRNLSAYPYDLANDPTGTAYEPSLDLISIFGCRDPPRMIPVCYESSGRQDEFVDCGIDYDIDLCFGNLCNSAERRLGGPGGLGWWARQVAGILGFVLALLGPGGLRFNPVRV